MKHIIIASVAALAVLTACSQKTNAPTDGSVIIMKASDTSQIRAAHLEAVNSVRTSRGLSPLVVSESLNDSAAAQGLEMVRQGRAWSFGRNGSSPQSRAAIAGYQGTVLGENIDESYDNAAKALQSWMNNPRASKLILDPNARTIGLGWYQETTGKTWWSQVIGR